MKVEVGHESENFEECFDAQWGTQSKVMKTLCWAQSQLMLRKFMCWRKMLFSGVMQQKIKFIFIATVVGVSVLPEFAFHTGVSYTI